MNRNSQDMLSLFRSGASEYEMICFASESPENHTAYCQIRNQDRIKWERVLCIHGLHIELFSDGYAKLIEFIKQLLPHCREISINQLCEVLAQTCIPEVVARTYLLQWINVLNSLGFFNKVSNEYKPLFKAQLTLNTIISQPNASLTAKEWMESYYSLARSVN